MSDKCTFTAVEQSDTKRLTWKGGFEQHMGQDATNMTANINGKLTNSLKCAKTKTTTAGITVSMCVYIYIYIYR